MIWEKFEALKDKLKEKFCKKKQNQIFQSDAKERDDNVVDLTPVFEASQEPEAPREFPVHGQICELSFRQQAVSFGDDKEPAEEEQIP